LRYKGHEILCLPKKASRSAGIEHAKTLVDKQTTLAVRKQR
jgi:hypothetical protein